MSELIKIKKPDESKIRRELVLTQLLENTRDGNHIDEAIEKANYPIYLHWTDLRHKSWIPEQFTPEEFWFVLKLLRGSSKKKTPIIDTKARPFTWNSIAPYDQILHQLDLEMGGRLLGLNSLNEGQKKKYLSRGLIEEAIASSQLEGAHTTREQAKKIIEENRTPQNTGQKMIVNNYKAMTIIEQEYKNKKLDKQLLFEMHNTLTEGTLEKPEQSGRFRTKDENILIASDEGHIAHIPPDIDFVDKQIDRLVSFANDEDEDGKRFIHPVIKAILLHFWMGYLHPFADGNGRLARALFYWYLLKKGYWVFAYIPVSTKIKRSPKQYANAYIYSEQDDNDLTYFIDYNLRKIQQAGKDFASYITEKEKKDAGIEEIQAQFTFLNDRQARLVQYLRAHPKEKTNVSAMTTINGVSDVTAIKDIKQMVSEGLLTKGERKGKNIFYYPTKTLLNTP